MVILVLCLRDWNAYQINVLLTQLARYPSSSYLASDKIGCERRDGLIYSAAFGRSAWAFEINFIPMK
jgi:hypothetical protein